MRPLQLFFSFLFSFFVFIAAAQNTIPKTTPREKKDKDDPITVLPQLVRGPYLQQATPKSMLIRWRTDALSRSRVNFGTSSAGLNGQVTDSALVTEHKILLTGLQPATRYFYTIGDVKNKLQGDTGNYFYSLPNPGDTDTYRIAAFGDCGNNSINQRNVRDQLLRYLGKKYLNAWILLGDNTYPDGTDAEFQANFFNIYKDNLLKHYPLFPSPGNHDYHDIEFSAAVAQQTHEIAYYQNFSMPDSNENMGVPSNTAEYYSFDIGNIHFLSLDSYGKADGKRLSDTSGPQATWIKRDLENAAGAEWIIAYWHHPPYTMGSHNSDTEKELSDIRENFIPLLERYGVDIVLGGHSHDYERSRLMYGYYGNDSAFDAARFNVSQSSGKTEGSDPASAYVKKTLRGKGTVYVVTGSAGKLGGMQKTFPHKAMYFSDAKHGGVSYIEVSGSRLMFKWICADGIVRDQFTMIKQNHL
jgi:acid phosphatase type 7